MATSHDLSTDSDYSNGDMRYQTSRGQGRVSNKVEHLAATLQDTNKNLRAMDRMLGDYRDLGSQHDHKVERLRDDLAKTTDRLRDEKIRSRDTKSPRGLRQSDLDDDYGRERQRRSRRTPTSPHRDYPQTASDQELYRHGNRADRPPHHGGAVRFYDDMDNHQVHQGLRDVASHQIRLDDDLDKEIDRRNNWEVHSKKTFQDLRDAIRKPDSTMTSVDKRLQSIQDELRSERLQLKKEHQEVGKISAELKKALDQQKEPQSTDDPSQLKTRVMQSDSHRNLLQTELEKIRQKLVHSEGSKQILLSQIDELKKQLSRSNEEKSRLRSHMDQQEDDMQTRLRKLTYDERSRDQQEQEHQRLESEIRELRGQLSKSASMVGEYTDTRRELDKSERQRTQLSDHIDVLSKDLEEREKQTAKIITQLQGMSEKYEQAEQQRHHLASQLEDSMVKLRETSKVSETCSVDLRDTQKQLQDSEGRKEEIKARAQETVRQWKAKCKKLERDVDRYKHSTEQATTRCEQLIKELELTRNHGNTSGQQLDMMKREFSELLAIRAQQDEQVRIKDIEVNELKSLKLDLENQLRDYKMVIERLEYELHSAREKFGSCLEDKNKLEDHMAVVESSQHLAQAHLQQIQKELQETSVTKVELSSQLADVVNQRMELKQALSESRKNETEAREEIKCLLHRCKEEKELYTKRVNGMTSELESMKSHESQRMQDISRRYKKEKAEYEAELQAMKIELQEERSSVKILKKQQDKLKQEVDRLNKELAIKEDESSQFHQQYHQVREDFLTKSLLTEDGLSRAKEVELELLDTREDLRKAVKDLENVCYSLAAEVDGVVEVASMESLQTYKALSMNKSLTSDPRQCVVEIKSKLEWLKNEFRERREKEQWLKTNMKDVAYNSEKDRQFLMTEIERQNDVLDQLSGSRVIEPSNKPERAVDDENIKQVTMDSDEEMVEKDLQINTSRDVTLDNSIVQETQKEREKIHERFARLQETMSTLKQELVDTRLYNGISEDPLSSTPKPQAPGSPILKHNHRKVTFDSSSRNDAQTPPPQSPGNRHHGNLQKTPPPLNLTDEEYAQRFLPKSPPKTNYDTDDFTM